MMSGASKVGALASLSVAPDVGPMADAKVIAL
jgi:hypothetical protein